MTLCCCVSGSQHLKVPQCLRQGVEEQHSLTPCPLKEKAPWSLKILANNNPARQSLYPKRSQSYETPL